MKTIKAQTKQITFLLLFILSFSCSKDDDSTDNTPNHFGTYTLSSISSNSLLDPNVDGEFNDDELIDNISCSSSIVLNADNTFNWDVLSIRQDVSEFLGVINSYDPIRCFLTENVTGQFIVDDIEISFESSANTARVSINENLIVIIIRPELIVDEGPILQKKRVNLTLTYER